MKKSLNYSHLSDSTITTGAFILGWIFAACSAIDVIIPAALGPTIPFAKIILILISILLNNKA